MRPLRVLASACVVGICGCGDKTPTQPSAAAPCTFACSSAQHLGAAGGTGTATVTTDASCGWSATADANWIALETAAQRTGPGDLFSIGP
jgi:hypothetical protein